MALERKSRAWARVMANAGVTLCAILLALLASEAVVRVFGLAPGLKSIELTNYDSS